MKLRCRDTSTLVEILEDGKKIGYITDHKEKTSVFISHFDIYGRVFGRDNEIYKKALRLYEEFVFSRGIRKIEFFSWRGKEIKFLLENNYTQRGRNVFEKENEN